MAFAKGAIKVAVVEGGKEVAIVEGTRKGPGTSAREKGVRNLSRCSREGFSSAATRGVRVR